MEAKINHTNAAIAEKSSAKEPPAPSSLTSQQLVKEVTGREVAPVHEIETKLLLSRPNGEAITIDELKSCISSINGIAPQPEFEGLLKAVVLKPAEGALPDALSSNPRFRMNIPDEGASWVTITAKEKPTQEDIAPPEGLKERIEYEDEIHDGRSHKTLAARLKERLGELGIPSEVKREKGSRKRRIRYAHKNGVHIEIDTLVDKKGNQLFPHYIEVEAHDRESVLATIQEVKKALEAIGITTELSGLSAKDLLRSVQPSIQETEEDAEPRSDTTENLQQTPALQSKES